MKDLKSKEEALIYLNDALMKCFQNDSSFPSFLIALRNVVKAQGGFSKYAKKIKVGRASLYKTLSDTGNPEWFTIISLCNYMGFNLKFYQDKDYA